MVSASSLRISLSKTSRGMVIIGHCHQLQYTHQEYGLIHLFTYSLNDYRLSRLNTVISTRETIAASSTCFTIQTILLCNPLILRSQNRHN